MLGPSFGNKDKMHPQDTRNLFIFFVIAIVIFFSYDALILKPQAEALRQTKIAQSQQQAAEEALAPAEPLEEIRSRPEALGQSPRVTLHNGKIKGSLSLRGARLDDVALEEYHETLNGNDNVILLSPKATKQPRYIDYGWVGEEKSNLALPGPDTLWQVTKGNTLTHDSPLTLRWDNGQGLVFERDISLDEDYMIKVTQRVINNSGREVKLYPYALISQVGIPEASQRTWLLIEGPIGYIGKELHEIAYNKFYKEKSKSFEAAQGWAGITDKYWLTALIPPQGENVKYNFKYIGHPPGKKAKDTGRYQIDYTGPAVTIAAGGTGESKAHAFIGAKKLLLLEKYEKELNVPYFNLAVNFGWFWFFAKPFFYALHFLGQFTGNFGVAIILLTVMIRTAVFPLTNISYKSFAKMKKVTPQVNALREKHGSDRAALQAELVKMYEREGVNPMAGCLPMLVQIPIFFALYKVLFMTIEMRHAPFFGWVQDLSAPDPTTIFNLFGLIDWNPPTFLHIGVWPLLMLTGMMIQRQLNPPPQDPIQRDMALYMPLLMTYMMASFAAGLVIYWTFSAFIGIIQQTIIMRSLDVPIYLFGQTDAEKKLEKSVDKGPAIHPLIEMAEERVEDAMFGDDDTPTEKQISSPKPKKKKKKK